jgi:hypothetical protein
MSLAEVCDQPETGHATLDAIGLRAEGEVHEGTLPGLGKEPGQALLRIAQVRESLGQLLLLMDQRHFCTRGNLSTGGTNEASVPLLISPPRVCRAESP